jgi:hypothetical protein
VLLSPIVQGYLAASHSTLLHAIESDAKTENQTKP